MQTTRKLSREAEENDHFLHTHPPPQMLVWQLHFGGVLHLLHSSWCLRFCGSGGLVPAWESWMCFSSQHRVVLGALWQSLEISHSDYFQGRVKTRHGSWFKTFVSTPLPKSHIQTSLLNNLFSKTGWGDRFYFNLTLEACPWRVFGWFITGELFIASLRHMWVMI